MNQLIRSQRTHRHGHPCRWLLVAILALSLNSGRATAAPETMSPPQILQELRGFGVMGTVLHVAAHPDDENTQLITYLAKGRMYRTAYLSVTRGDGGQNLLGPEFDEQLGLARTQELLAARRLDGGKQFFTRAIDFGYSKSTDEALRIWGKQEVLGDVVRVIRVFRPDVIVTRFTPQSGGHGHHTASAVLANEAFKLAGDPKAYPEQLTEMTVWQPKRIFANGGGGGRGGAAPAANALRIEVGGTDPVSGETFASIASQSRRMHKTQGFDQGGRGGGARGGGNAAPTESFLLTDGEPAANDIMDGIDTTWARVGLGGVEIARLTEEAIAKFNQQDPAASIPALLAIRTRVTALPADPIVTEKRQQLDRIIQHCLGLAIESTVAQAEAVPGETIKIHHAVMQSSTVPVRWMGVRYPVSKSQVNQPIPLAPKQPAVRDATQTVPADIPLTQPYWLAVDGTAGLFGVTSPSLIGTPENAPAYPIEHVFEVGGQTITIPDEPVQVLALAPNGSTRRRLDIIGPISMRFLSEVRLFAPGASRPVEVEVTAWRDNIAGELQLSGPAGWTIAPAAQPFRLSSVGQKQKVSFNVAAPANPAGVRLSASAKINGSRQYSNQRMEVNYPHIPLQILQPPARDRAVVLDVAIRGKEVGYFQGAGDSVAECLEQMGYNVTQLTGDDMTEEKLKRFDAVVVGIRVFDDVEARNKLNPNLPALFAFAEQGGNVIFQYNRTSIPGQLGPFALQLPGNAAAARVTNENAPVTFLVPDHPALNTPNKITNADFDGWVQERGIYFPTQWDERFTPILGISDPGEQPLHGGLLVAKHGKGNVVYTGLVFFRELPEGVPGAYRLFANLVSLGK